jgi:hypothetical protein
MGKFAVDRVREMLGLEAKAVVLAIDNTLLASRGSVQEVVAVELDARPGGEHFQEASSLGFVDSGR